MEILRENKFKVKDNADDTSHIKVQLYYDLGGGMYGKKRGYYVSVQPVTIKEHGNWKEESFVAYTGYTYLAVPVNRKSSKAERQAIEKYDFVLRNKTFMRNLNNYELEEQDA